MVSSGDCLQVNLILRSLTYEGIALHSKIVFSIPVVVVNSEVTGVAEAAAFWWWF